MHANLTRNHCCALQYQELSAKEKKKLKKKQKEKEKKLQAKTAATETAAEVKTKGKEKKVPAHLRRMQEEIERRRLEEERLKKEEEERAIREEQEKLVQILLSKSSLSVETRAKHCFKHMVNLWEESTVGRFSGKIFSVSS